MQYHVLHIEIYREGYAHQMLIRYFPFRNEAELKLNGSYANELSFLGILDTVNFNKR